MFCWLKTLLFMRKWSQD